QRSKLDWSSVEREEHASLRRLYKALLAVRREHPALRSLDLDSLEAIADDAKNVLLVRRWSGSQQALVAFNFSDESQSVDAPSGAWRELLETNAKIDGGRVTLPPHSFGVWSN
ncbi:MAG TPA: DUF3459 domain-containing protein, partial [Thermoanaerobaculia bacterium]